MKITVIGVGYVGLVTAVCLAEMGNQVCCVEKEAGNSLLRISPLKKVTSSAISVYSKVSISIPLTALRLVTRYLHKWYPRNPEAPVTKNAFASITSHQTNIIKVGHGNVNLPLIVCYNEEQCQALFGMRCLTPIEPKCRKKKYACSGI